MEEWQDYVSQDDLYYHLEICTQAGNTCDCILNGESEPLNRTLLLRLLR